MPSGWLWARLNVHKMAELSKDHKLAKVDSDPDASGFIALVQAFTAMAFVS